jgi:hypothetical protein
MCCSPDGLVNIRILPALKKRDFIASLKRFLLSYRPAGRLTIFRYLNMFFIWQSVNQYDYGTAEGVEMYIKHLMNDIRRRKISVRMARHYLSVVNRFLLTGGQIQRRYEYEFLPKGTYQQQEGIATPGMNFPRS